MAEVRMLYRELRWLGWLLERDAGNFFEAFAAQEHYQRRCQGVLGGG